MVRTSASKLSRLSLRQIRSCTTQRSSTLIRTSLHRYRARPIAAQIHQVVFSKAHRPLSTSSTKYKGLSPESEDPPPPETEDHHINVAPADISHEEYHELADQYLEILVDKLEQLQEESEEIEVEYSQGVLNLTFPPAGTYVINKQPPNKQIWLSSPVSGPKRFDWVIFAEGQDSKEGTGKGNWVYLRDGSTLNGIMLAEVGVDLDLPYEPVTHRVG